MRDIQIGDRVDILEKWGYWRDHAIDKIRRADNLRVFEKNTNIIGTYLYLENDDLPMGYICIRKHRVKLSKPKKVRRIK